MNSGIDLRREEQGGGPKTTCHLSTSEPAETDGIDFEDHKDEGEPCGPPSRPMSCVIQLTWIQLTFALQSIQNHPPVGSPQAPAPVARAVVGTHHHLLPRARRPLPPILLRLVLASRLPPSLLLQKTYPGEQQQRQQPQEAQIRRCWGRLSDRGGRDVQPDKC